MKICMDKLYPLFFEIKKHKQRRFLKKLDRDGERRQYFPSTKILNGIIFSIDEHASEKSILYSLTSHAIKGTRFFIFYKKYTTEYAIEYELCRRG